MLSFARTKIQPPRPRPGQLQARPQLESRLADALLSQRLVLVQAAAGYGKTSALARQVQALPAGTALAWVSCDLGDSPLRLFQCLVSALEPHDLPWRVEPEALMAGAAGDGTPAGRSRGLRAMVAALINALDACDVPHGVIVVDDLHRIEHPAVYEFLDLLLERFTPRWTLVVATRHAPPIALPRLRALGEVAEFGLDDLRFERDEALAFVQGAGLDAATADTLFERTQGWPVALRLALHARGGARAVSAAPVLERPMFDFLATEVVDCLPADLRQFLLHTSVLPELTAARCAALTGDAQAEPLLERVERAGLAVCVMGGPGLSLRLHDLLREALEQRLLREQPEAVPALCARAAATEPDAGRRIDYLLRAGDAQAAAQALLDHTPQLLTLGTLSSLQHLLDRTAAAGCAATPQWQQVQGMLGWARWDFALMRDAMQQAEAGYRAAGQPDRALQALAYQSAALVAFGQAHEVPDRLLAHDRRGLALETHLMVLLARQWHAMDIGRLHDVGPLLDETMDLLETTTDPSLWYRAHTIPRLNGLPGTARALDRYTDGVLRLTADQPSPLRAMAHTQRALRALWRGHADEAQEALDTARADARWLGHPPNVNGTLNLGLALLAAHRGDRAGALGAARQLVDQHPPQRGPWSLAGNLFNAARVAAVFDDAAAFDGFLADLEALRGRVPAALDELLLPLLGMQAALQGRRGPALQLLAAAVADEHRSDRLGLAVEIRLRLAAEQLADDQDSAAVQTLSPLVERVRTHAGVGGLLMAPTALRCLARAATDHRLGDTLGPVVIGWAGLLPQPVGREVAAGPTAAAAAGPDNGLSSREREVLARIAAGDSNKLIARAFDLSPHTVKRHVANILDKLDLRSRGQAAAWFQQHGG